MTSVYNRAITFSLLGASTIGALSSCSTESKAAKVNIVFIMTDDHTAQMMSCYGSKFVETPSLDRIAADGVRFTNSFVANSISGPSRACMLTGKHSHKNGFYDNTSSVFDGEQPTFPKLLQQVGYQTALIGKWHLESTPTGFDHWDIIPGQGEYYNPDFFDIKGDTTVVKGYLTDIITDKSIEWLDKSRDESKPFCLLIHHKATHRNWLSDIKNLPLYEDREFELPANLYDTYEGRTAAASQQMHIAEDMDLIYDLKMNNEDVTSSLKARYLYMIGRMDTVQRQAWDDFYNPIMEKFYASNLSGRELTEWKYQRYMRDYAKTLKSLDDSVGEVLDYLESRDMMDNTLVVYTSDQGFYMGEHGWFDKRFMYEESMRTPLIMSLPKGYNTRGVVDEMVQNIDYAPTFLQLAGVDIPTDIQGKSLVPLLTGEPLDSEWRDALYYHYYDYPAEHMVKCHYGVRTERYKLIHFYDDIDEWELYDLESDSSEMNNLYGQKGTERITEQLKARLSQLRKEYDIENKKDRITHSKVEF